MKAKILQVGDDRTGCSSYLLHTDSSLFMIDTSLPSYAELLLGRVVKYMKESKGELKAVILTHEHIDHSGGAWLIQKELDIPIFAHPAAKEILTQGKEPFIGGWLFGENFHIPREILVLDNGKIELPGGYSLTVFYTPGHSPGSLVLYDENNRALFSGDLFFTMGSVGRWDLPGGDLEKLCTSLKRLMNVDFISLFPGHGEPALDGGREHLNLALRYMEGIC